MSSHNQSPLLSIIMPHYNMLDTIQCALDSILEQSLTSLEVILVDDGSCESCRGLVQNYRRKGLGIRLFELGANHGSKYACLFGFKQAIAPYVTVLSADDFLIGSWQLEYHLRMAIREDADILHYNSILYHEDTGIEEIWKHGRPIGAMLLGTDIFAAYTAERTRAHSLSDKIIKRSLWQKCISDAESVQVSVEGEDYFLLTMIYMNARKYIGSDIAGHYYHFTTPAKRRARMVNYIVNTFRMRTFYAMHLQGNNIPPGDIQACAQGFERSLSWRTKRLWEAVTERYPNVDADPTEAAGYILSISRDADLPELLEIFSFISGKAEIDPEGKNAAENILKILGACA